MKICPRIWSRRDFNKHMLALASVTLLNAGFSTRAFAGNVSPVMTQWLKDIHQSCNDVKMNQLDADQWGARMDALFRSVKLEDLLSLMDFDRLASGLSLPDRWGAHKSVRFPKINGMPQSIGGEKIFVYRKGRATSPHAHNNMVSVHVILKGRMHVRTFDRVRDETGFLLLKPSIDQICGPGSIVTMSDNHDNVHWFHAVEEAATLNIPVVNLQPGKPYPTPANKYSMIYVDPLGPTTAEGLIKARVLSFNEAETLYSKEA